VDRRGIRSAGMAGAATSANILAPNIQRRSALRSEEATQPPLGSIQELRHSQAGRKGGEAGARHPGVKPFRRGERHVVPFICQSTRQWNHRVEVAVGRNARAKHPHEGRSTGLSVRSRHSVGTDIVEEWRLGSNDHRPRALKVLD
jgi:hypothetical protein